MMRAVFMFRFPNGATLELVRGDITELEVDAIVNAANPYLEHGGGVAAAIVRRGGYVIQEESREWVRRYGPLPLGGVAVTSAGRLRARYVIHTVGPRCGVEPIEAIGDAVVNVLRKAEELNLVSVAFPGISTGVFGCPYEGAARVMARALRNEVPRLRSVRRMILCLYSDEAHGVFSRVFNEELGDMAPSMDQ
jgi:O-acetyl-ADP-ribose deacetylase (regulator of RNase III)